MSEDLTKLQAATEAALAAQGIRAQSTSPDAPRRTSVAMNPEDDTPAYKSPLYEEMVEDWKLCRDLFVGTKAVRADSGEYIPKAGSELDEEYAARVKRTECYPGFEQSVKGLTGIALRTDPQLKEDVPQIIKDHAEDIDGHGTHLAIFAQRLFEDGMTVGHGGILVDVPQAPKEKAGRTTKRDERILGIRPYWVHVHAENIYSWRTQVVGGKNILTQLVLHEPTIEPAGEFTVMSVVRWRVFRLDVTTGVVSWEIWEMDDDQKPRKTDDGVVLNQTRIPFVPFYAGPRLSPLHTRPPLLNLAYTNISHVQVSSDRRHSLHIASVPFLLFKGRPISHQVDEDGNPRTQQIGSNIGLDVPTDGDAKYVEHSGSALGALRDELRDLESRMAFMGLAMLQAETRAAETAEAKKIDKSEKDSVLSRALRNLNDALELALAFHASFLKLPEGGSVYMSRDFVDKGMDSGSIQVLSNLVTAGQLDLETMWVILQQHGVLPEDMNFDAVLRKILLNSMPPETGTGDDEDEDEVKKDKPEPDIKPRSYEIERDPSGRPTRIRAS